MFARPIAHRGFHKINGELENTRGAFRAAIKADYAIECDLQLTADGEAVVFHDFTTDRLMTITGQVANKTTQELKAASFKNSKDKIMTLFELLQLVSEKVPLVIEIKSAFNGDMTLTHQAIRTLKGYNKACLMSFDPAVVIHLKQNAPQIMRGIVSQNRYIAAEWATISEAGKKAMVEMSHLNESDPHFVSWKVVDLPNAATTHFRDTLKRPLICWTVRSDLERRLGALHADQVTFEGYEA